MINLVAEIGINHNGSLQVAFELIRIAKEAGFDYVKFQKRCPDICVPEHQKNIIKETIWGNMLYVDYKEKIELDLYDYEQINKFCEKIGIKWFTSVWDMESACDIYMVNNTIVKIPSAKINDVQLLEYCREYFDNVIISTGMSNEADIQKAVAISRPDVIMHSVAVYPTPVEMTRIGYVKWLVENYRDKGLCKQVGYSGHDKDIGVAIVAILLGSEWIEKHITLSNYMFGSDQKISLEPKEMFEFVKVVRSLEKIMKGNEPREILDEELEKLEQLRGLK